MKKPKKVLKSYFETGDKPTQQQFEDLIDSLVHQDVVGDKIFIESIEKDKEGNTIVNLSNDTSLKITSIDNENQKTQSDWSETDKNNPSFILNKPLIPSIANLIDNSNDQSVGGNKTFTGLTKMTGQFNTNTLAVSGKSDFNDVAKFNSDIQVDGNSSLANIITKSLVINDSADTASIAGSKFTLKDEKTAPDDKTVSAFIDVKRNISENISEKADGGTFGLVSRITSTSNVNDDSLTAIDSVARHKGNGKINNLYGVNSKADAEGEFKSASVVGTVSQASYNGGGETDLMSACYNFLNIEGKSNLKIKQIRSNLTFSTLDNANANVDWFKGLDVITTLTKGTVNKGVQLLKLEMNSNTDAVVNGNISYIASDNDTLPTLGSGVKAYFIKSDTQLPSEFAGTISTNVTTSQIDKAGSKSLITKEYLDDVVKIKTIKVIVTNPKLDASGKFIQELIPAQGTNQYINVISAVCKLNVTTAYPQFAISIVNNAPLALEGTSYNLFTSYPINNLEGTKVVKLFTGPLGRGTLELDANTVTNQSVSCVFQSSPSAKGVGTFTFFITYEVLDLN